jgi:hypothetical protein
LQKHEINSINVGYNYTGKYTEHKNDLINYLKKLVLDEIERKILLNHVSKGLVGNNKPCREQDKDKICLNIYGSRNNGKTTFINLIAATMGDYFTIFDSKILTEPIKNQLEELCFLIDKRYIVTEISPANKINSRMYKISISIKQTHSMCVVSNGKLKFNSTDEGVRRRTRCIEFPNTITSKMEMGEKIKLWKQDFMLLLIENYCYSECNQIEQKMDLQTITNNIGINLKPGKYCYNRG